MTDNSRNETSNGGSGGDETEAEKASETGFTSKSDVRWVWWPSVAAAFILGSCVGVWAYMYVKTGSVSGVYTAWVLSIGSLAAVWSFGKEAVEAFSKFKEAQSGGGENGQ